MAMKEKLAVSVDGDELTEALVLIRTRAPDLDSVKKLNCWACNIGDVSVVRRMPNLEVCSLTINKITSLQDFAHCYNLQELYVRTNNIQRLNDIHYLKNLKKLRSLWLSENPCATGDNYRMTVLKTLPNLQKLDNIAVSGNEIARAQEEGDDLPLPNDFSFSAILKEASSCSEEYRDELKGESVSESSEKWARPRQKRQQKKREDYWRVKKGAHEESSGVKSGDESGSSSTKSGEDGGGHNVRSSSDSGDGEDCCKVKVEGTMNVSRSDVDAGQFQEEEEVGEPGKVVNDTGHVVVRTEHRNDSSARVSWAMKVELPSNMADSDGRGVEDKNENKVIDKMVEVCEFCDDDKGEFDQKSDGGKRLTKCNKDGQAIFVPSELCDGDPSVSAKRQCESGWSCDNNLILEFGKGLDLAPETASDSINVWNISAADTSNTSISNVSTTTGINKGSLNFDDQLNYSVATDDKVTGQTETPLLDRIRLDDSQDILDQTEDQSHPIEALELEKSADLMLALSALKKFTLFEDPSTHAEGTETITTESETSSAENSKEPVNWKENPLRVHPEVRSEDIKLSTSKLVNTNKIKTSASSIVNSNILQAVLCLVQELDKDSLHIVVSEVKGRLDNM